MASGTKVQVVIVNWNGKEKLLECLASINKLKFPSNSYSVLVVDNGSCDGSSQAALNSYPGIQILENKSNLGYVKAVNQGIDYALKACAEYVWILNNDVVVEEDCLSKLAEAGFLDNKIGVVCPVVYSYDRLDRIDNAGYRINFWTGRLNKAQFTKEIFCNNEKIEDIDSLLGCANLVKTSVIKQIGSYREIYDLYFEETDFNVRAKRHGFRVVVVKDARVWHKGAYTMNRFIGRRAFLLLRNLFIFELLNAKLRNLLVFIPYYFFIHIPYFLIRGIAYGLKAKQISTKR